MLNDLARAMKALDGKKRDKGSPPICGSIKKTNEPSPYVLSLGNQL